MKSLPIFLLLLLLAQYAPAQTIRYTKGVYNYVPSRYGTKSYYTYHVDGKSYKLPALSGRTNGEFHWKFPHNYLIGYQELHPDSAWLYGNKPYFDSTVRTERSAGTVYFLNKRYCDFQFRATGVSKEPVLARQAISETDVKRYGIRPGASYEVEYLKTDPAVAIIHWDAPAAEPVMDYRHPYLPHIYGYYGEIETRGLFLDCPAANQYLQRFSQSPIPRSIMYYGGSCGYHFRSGWGTDVSLGGGGGFMLASAGGSYLERISQRHYINLALHAAVSTYTRSAFQNDQLSAVAPSSEFYYSSGFCLNPRIEIARRRIRDNVSGCQMLKLGVGAYFALNDGTWQYDIEKEVTSSKGKPTHKTVFDQYLNTVPGLSKSVFYISLSYSFASAR